MAKKGYAQYLNSCGFFACVSMLQIRQPTDNIWNPTYIFQSRLMMRTRPERKLQLRISCTAQTSLSPLFLIKGMIHKPEAMTATCRSLLMVCMVQTFFKCKPRVPIKMIDDPTYSKYWVQSILLIRAIRTLIRITISYALTIFKLRLNSCF